MGNLRYCFRWLITLGIVIHAVPTLAQIGMVSDQGSNKVVVFNGATNTVLGTVSIPGSPNLYDCAVMPDQTLGFTVDFAARVWVINLTTSPPSLAAGTNPIPISNNGEDIAITADKQFLVVCDGGGTQPVSAVRIASRTQVSTLATGEYTNAIEACPDGSILVGAFSPGTVRRLKIDSGGNLTNTGEVLSGGQPMNVYCAPDGVSGIVVDFGTNTVRSFKINGLGLVDTRSLPDQGLCGAISPAGDRIYVRTLGGSNRVVAFGFNSATGALSTTPIFSIPVGIAQSSFYGVEQLALNPDGTKLYVPEPGTSSVRIYDASNGNFLTSITNPSIVEPVGISFGGNVTSIAGMVWEDLNGDGTKDIGELGLAGWTVNLEGPVTMSTTTDLSGTYLFSPLLAGTYIVSEQIVAGWLQTAPPARTYTITLATNQFSSSNDFGNRNLGGGGRGTVRGVVFDDRNGNGVRDAGELGLPDWTVELNGRGVRKTIQTDVGGNYLFTGLPQGAYTVTQMVPDGWVQTLPADGQPYSLTLANNADRLGVDFGNRDAVTGVNEPAGNPDEYALYQNYPNPFNPTTRLSFYLPKDGYVTLKVYNVLGIEIASLFEGRMSVGTHSLVWDAQDIPSGVYVYRLSAGNFVAVKKMVLMK